jgi:FtsX-like permease family
MRKSTDADLANCTLRVKLGTQLNFGATTLYFSGLVSTSQWFGIKRDRRNSHGQTEHEDRSDRKRRGGWILRRKTCGLWALLLAAIGIYGLMAYSVAQRTQEMGIRMALGADRDAIRKLVVWQGMRLTLVGVVAGIAPSFGLTRLLSTFLFGVSPGIPRSSYRRHSFSPRLRCSPCGCLPRAPPRSIPRKRCARSNADMAIVVRSAQPQLLLCSDISKSCRKVFDLAGRRCNSTRFLSHSPTSAKALTSLRQQMEVRFCKRAGTTACSACR